MSNTSSPPLRLELHASAWLGTALVALAGLAAAGILFSSLPVATLALVSALAWHAVLSLRRDARATLVFRADGSAVRVHDDGGETALQPRHFVERGPLAVIVVDVDGRTRRFVTAPDTLPQTTRRLLRLWFGRHVRAVAPRREAAHA